MIYNILSDHFQILNIFKYLYGGIPNVMNANFEQLLPTY